MESTGQGCACKSARDSRQDNPEFETSLDKMGDPDSKQKGRTKKGYHNPFQYVFLQISGGSPTIEAEDAFC